MLNFRKFPFGKDASFEAEVQCSLLVVQLNTEIWEGTDITVLLKECSLGASYFKPLKQCKRLSASCSYNHVLVCRKDFTSRSRTIFPYCLQQKSCEMEEDCARQLVLRSPQDKSTESSFTVCKLWHYRLFPTQVRTELHKILSFPWFSEGSSEQNPLKMKLVASSPWNVVASFQLRPRPAAQVHFEPLGSDLGWQGSAEERSAS